MPRKARPIPKQQFPTGLPYGKQKALEEQAAALPQARRPAMPPPAQTSPMNSQPAPTGAPQPNPLQQIVQQGWDIPPATPFGAPTQRPLEPVTAGLPVGPGAGPEALPQFQTDRNLSNFLMDLAAATGDDAFIELANINNASRNV